MRSLTKNRFLGGLFLGALCGVAMALGAAFTGFTLGQVNMTSTSAREPTPTVEQLQQFLETITAAPDPLPTPEAPAWSVGSTQPTPAVTSTTTSGTSTTTSSTPAPATQPSTLSGRATTPAVPVVGTNDATPQPTTTTSLNAPIPTRTPFVPPVIVPIQPLSPSTAP